MNCETYLSMLSTLPVDELTYGDAREHAATCRDCDRVTRVVAERERNMLIAYGEMYSPVDTEPMVARAIELSRRQRIAFFYRIGLGIAGVAAVLVLLVGRVAVTRTHRVTGTFELRCLTPEQAIALVRPDLPPGARILAMLDSRPKLVRFSATPSEAGRIRSLLAAHDGPTGCTVISVPDAPPPR